MSNDEDGTCMGYTRNDRMQVELNVRWRLCGGENFHELDRKETYPQAVSMAEFDDCCAPVYFGFGELTRKVGGSC